MTQSDVFKLFACCFPVKGNKQSIICDTQRHEYLAIPESLFEILTFSKNKSIQEIQKRYDFNPMISEYFNFLAENEFGFWVNKDEVDNFPDIELVYENPSIIDNIIIDIGQSEQLFNNVFYSDLEKLGCKFLEIRVYDITQLDSLLSILNETINSRLINITIYMPDRGSLNTEDVKLILIKYKRIGTFIIYASSQFKSIKTDWGDILYLPDIINSKKHCGVIKPHFFSSEVSVFIEAQQHNTCLNRKISIDTEGYIRNCPSMPEHYGNIKDTTLREALQHPDFKKYWFINKDQISVCKDCEFRYICTDCRAYRENPEDLYSKPLKCGYNPYTGEWEEWSTNPLKQKAIDYYGMRELIKN